VEIRLAAATHTHSLSLHSWFGQHSHHRVPLSPLASRLLSQAKQLADSPWVFPGRKPSRHICGDTVDHALQRNRAVLGLADLTPRDLRRTAASHMTGMGISRLVIGKILNHAESGITAVYDRHNYAAEQHQALDAWGRKLQSIIDKDFNNVVPLQSKVG
jgi:integrase